MSSSTIYDTNVMKLMIMFFVAGIVIHNIFCEFNGMDPGKVDLITMTS